MATADKNQELSESELIGYCQQVAEEACTASKDLLRVKGEQIDNWLKASADRLIQEDERITEANQQDLANAIDYGLTSAQVDRLKLDGSRIEGIAQGLRDIAMLDSPVGEVFESRQRPNGLLVNKIRVPLGVIFFIYESRPNVTADAAAIAAKSRNAIVLRGGKEAMFSSRAIVELLSETARQFDLPEKAVQLIQTTDRRVVDQMIRMNDLIDLAIPRGGETLIRLVSERATMPVMKHFAGNCHVYVDALADQDKAIEIVVNSKCHRLGVCNAAESLLVHDEIAGEFLPKVLRQLRQNQIEIRGDEKVCQVDPEAVLATDEDYGAEYLDAIISVRCVSNIEDAITHINRYGSGHTDAIVSQDIVAIDQFVEQVDSAAVMVNTSTRFNDGGEFGLGAEIGISTDKFHARGPCGLKELTTYKYVCKGDGQIR